MLLKATPIAAALAQSDGLEDIAQDLTSHTPRLIRHGSYATAPISDILALPEKGEWSTGLEAMAIYAAYDETAVVRAYYKHREELLSKASGIPEPASIEEHVKAIQERAKEQMEPYVKSSTLLLDTLNKYKDYLSDESGLDRNRPVDDHIHEIVKNSMEAGAAEERDRIQEKIYEVLLS